MAVSLSEIKSLVLNILYDYMLSSDEEAYYFTLSDIREEFTVDVSGAMTKVAIRSLVSEDVIELGEDDDGKEIYAITEKGILRAEKEISERGTPLAQYSIVPASDRIVTRSDNSKTVIEISTALAEISRELAENNEAAIVLGDNRELIATEIDAGKLIASKEKFRLQRLLTLLVPALKFLSDKFVGTALGETAKRLIKLLFES